MGQYCHFLSLKKTSSFLLVAHNQWILDSGATHHINSSLESLTDINKNLSMEPISLSSENIAKITMTDTIPINNTFQLNNVLCVPSFKVDLMCW